MNDDALAGQHLSDFRFDRLLARELDGTPERDAALAHLAVCAACADRYGALERQTAAFAEEAARRQVAERIAGRTAAPRRRRWPWVGGLTLAAAACGLLLLFRPQPDSDLRAKGSLGLEVWVARPGGASESLLPGATVSPGDRLRFGASTRTGGHVAVASVDPAGVVSLYVPATADRLPAIAAGTTLLDGAVELDKTLGRERLIALLCSAPLESGRVVGALTAALRAADGDPLALNVDRAALGCAHTSFWLQKVPAR